MLDAILQAASALGMLGGGNGQQDTQSLMAQGVPADMAAAMGTNPSAADQLAASRKAAAAALAKAMRQQTPSAPATGDTFDQRFSAADDAPPLQNVPLPQARPNMDAAPTDNSLDNLYLKAPNQQQQPAQAAQPAPAVAAPASSPSFGDRAIAALANFGAGGHNGGLFGALTGAAEGAATGQRFDPIGVQNQTVQALSGIKGMTPGLAQLIARDPQALNQLLPVLMGVKPWSIQKISSGFGPDRLIAVNPNNPNESMPINPSAAHPQQPAQSPQQNIVRQNGHTYQLQPDGSYRAIQ